MAVDFFSDGIDFSLDNSSSLSNWLEASVVCEGFEMGDVNVIFCSDDYLLNMNKQFLEHDYYTDVITFDYSEDSIISGDLFISIDRVTENAVLYQQIFQVELNRILIHGVLHLCGYEDKETNLKELMTSKEDFYLNKLTIY